MAKRAKEIALFVLAVLALVVAVFTFRSAPTPAAARSTPAAPTPTARPRLAKATPAATVPTSAPVTVAKSSSRNPFLAPPGAPVETSPEGTTPQSTPPPAPAPASAALPAPAAGTAPPLPTGRVGSTGSGLPTPPLGVTPGGPAPSAPVLAGVVLDSSGRPTAVIREGERRHFARAGDEIAGKYRVQSVTSREVVLAGTQGKLILKMGGNR